MTQMLDKIELIDGTNGVGSNYEKLLFISSFNNATDKEIVSILSAWLTFCDKKDLLQIKKTIMGTMKGNPSYFVKSYPICYIHDHSFLKRRNETLYKTLTWGNFHFLLIRLYELLFAKEGFENEFNRIHGLLKTKEKNVYDIMATMFAGNTGFPTRNGMSFFYRYNLLYYWLSYKLGIWKSTPHVSNNLPCNDRIYEKALEMGIIKDNINSCAKKTMCLTKKAKEMFGEWDCYKLYEILDKDGN